MPNTAQILFALAMVVWVVDVRFAPKTAAVEVGAQSVCHGGPSSSAPSGTDLEVVVCAPRSK
ncbi:MAG TPA: hypothetical protein VHM25_26820 [Polyangiaceae bacterium]|jgi:hypothetical protein|nr:hypothetical protein [Polyangiaceae bacterium]